MRAYFEMKRMHYIEYFHFYKKIIVINQIGAYLEIVSNMRIFKNGFKLKQSRVNQNNSFKLSHFTIFHCLHLPFTSEGLSHGGILLYDEAL